MQHTDKELEQVIKALANRRRISIVRLLKHRTHASVGIIAHEIKLSFRATSKHLGILSSVGIVDRTQQSLLMLYRLGDDIPTVAQRIIGTL
jgi:DNA-binding transcriptional ArsR family regulator